MTHALPPEAVEAALDAWLTARGFFDNRACMRAALTAALPHLVEEAVREEREACAKLADRALGLMFPRPRNRIVAENASHVVAQAIRARSAPPPVQPDADAALADPGEEP